MSRPNDVAFARRRMERHQKRRLDVLRDAPAAGDSAMHIRQLVERHFDSSADVAQLLPRAPPASGGAGAGQAEEDDPLSDFPGFEPQSSSTSATPTATRAVASNPMFGGNDDDDGDEGISSAPTPTRTLATVRTTATPRSSTQGFFDSLFSDVFGDDESSTSTPTSTRTLFRPITTSTTSSSSSSSSSSTSTSTSSTSSTRSPSTVRSSSSRERPDPASSTSTISSSSIAPITATRLVTSTPIESATPSIAASDASSKSNDSSGPGAGPIIGIVAGSLVGVVILTGLAGFLFKKYKRKASDPFEANPFDRDAFQRHSTMIPDHFDSDDGHMPPSMSEHHQDGFPPSYASGVVAGAGAAMLAHNEGGPRPPTMFARHANGPAAQFDSHQQQMYNAAPQVGAYYKADSNGEYTMQQESSPQMDYQGPTAAFGNRHLDEPVMPKRSVSPAPQLPPLAAFGGDPYSIAGVGVRMNDNIANPYAHLDRGYSMSSAQVSPRQPTAARPDTASSASHGGSPDQYHQQHNSAAAEALVAGLAHQAQLQQQQHQRSVSPSFSQAGGAGTRTSDFDTAGRPGTSEGRSGTPDLPNVQQTYAIGTESDDGHQMRRTGSIGGASLLDTNRFSASSQDVLAQMSNRTHGGVTSATSPPISSNGGLDPFAHPADRPAHEGQTLSVRNLMPGGSGASADQQQRPISTASSFADPDDAYGGVY